MLLALDQLLDTFIGMGIPGNDCAVYYKGKCVYRKQRGFSDYEKKTEMNGSERYNIYSCSKPITCAAALQLWEKGAFSLEHRLDKYIPEFSEMRVKCEDGSLKRAEKPILIKHLFEMTSGLGYDTASPSLLAVRKETDGKCPTLKVMKYLAREPLSFEPGERWQYSFSHDVLAALVELLCGERYSEYVKKNIFDPLGMVNSTFNLPTEEQDSLCAQYVYANGEYRNYGKHIQFYKLGSEYDSGGAGCISTVDDYMKFLEAMRLGDVILKKETVDLMATNRLTESQRPAGDLGWLKTYGYGLGVRCYREGSNYCDFGWNGAAGAHMAIDRENEISIYYAQHVLGSPIAKIRHMVYAAARDEILARPEIFIQK